MSKIDNNKSSYVVYDLGVCSLGKGHAVQTQGTESSLWNPCTQQAVEEHLCNPRPEKQILAYPWILLSCQQSLLRSLGFHLETLSPKSAAYFLRNNIKDYLWPPHTYVHRH